MYCGKPKTVKMTQSEFNEILKRYHQDRCTPAEVKLVEAWLDAVEKDTPAPDLKTTASASDMWRGVERRIGKAGQRAWSYRPIVRVAASVTVLALSLFLVLTFVKPDQLKQYIISGDDQMITFTNTGNKVEKIDLSDGSFVLVHPASEVHYPRVFSGDTREVSLSGEAFFEIAKDPEHPFLVHANEVTTRVLGTSFTIKAYKEQKEVVVAVKTGKVSVFSGADAYKQAHQARAEVILTPNQQVVYNREEGRVTRQLVEHPDIIQANASRELVYTNAPVTQVFNALEEMYGVDIQYDEKALSGCTITTEMTDEGLFERMDLICHVLSARYKVEDTIIVLEAEGCAR